MSIQTTDRRRVILGPSGEVVHNFSDRRNVSTVDPMALAGSFQGTDIGSRDRGYVYLPTLDTLKEVDAWSHTELLTRGRFIYNSGGGFVHRAVNGVARMICGTGLFPYPLSKKKAWNRKVRALWASRCENKNTFDLSKKFTCGAAQVGIMRSQIRDGDVAPVLARDEDGRLRCMFYEAQQIGMGSTRVDPSARFMHGVRLGPHNAPVAYRVLERDFVTGKESFVDVPAANVLFCTDYERFGQVRGLSRFYPVINKTLDLGEILAALTKGIKMREQIGYAIEQQLPQQMLSGPGAWGAGVPNPKTKVDVGGGHEITLEKFFGGGESHELKPGQSFKIVESDHPNENVREHISDLRRDIAAALDFSVELLWNVERLGGANTRFIMADAQSKIELEQQRLVEQFLGPWYIAWIRDMIEAGEIEDVDDWEAHTWLLPKRLTVDFGRDGKLHIEQWKRGMITMKALYGFVGDEWMPEIDQYLDERLYIKEGLSARGLSWAEGFPEIGSSTTAAQEQAAAASADTQQMAQQVEEIHAALARANDNKPVRL